MSLSLFTQTAPKATEATVGLEPVYNVLISMALLTAPGLDRDQEPWLVAAAGRLSAEQRHHNRLVFEALGAALLPTKEYSSFATYADALTAQNPSVLRERIDVDLLSQIDAPLQAEATQLLRDPAAMQQLIVNHLRTLWKT
ncbi:MAG: hypothetical protein KDE54_31620, partial [Caldilineaceae bacterium]|nr:hypothetical protein [Caldilineaceae bacterium]